MTSTFSGIHDTERAIEARRAELFRSMSPKRKVELVEDANRTARELALAGIATRYPTATKRQHYRLLLGLVIGEPLASEIYGPPPVLDDDST